MMSNSSSGEFRYDRSANSSITSRSSRRWIEVSTSGSASVMKPGLLPVLWIDVPPRRQAASIRSRDAGSMLGRVVELAAGRDHVDAGLEQPAQHVDVAAVRHVEDAVGAEARRSSSSPAWR